MCVYVCPASSLNFIQFTARGHKNWHKMSFLCCSKRERAIEGRAEKGSKRLPEKESEMGKREKRLKKGEHVCYADIDVVVLVVLAIVIGIAIAIAVNIDIMLPGSIIIIWGIIIIVVNG